MPIAKAKKNELVYQIKISLKGAKPPIWRRIQVLDSERLSDLDSIIQIVMGWDNSHLHQFIINMEYYSDPGMLEQDEVKNEYKFKLKDFNFKKKDKFLYEYDFGDGWTHELLIEKIMPPKSDQKYPLCITGKLSCPPEDCGGLYGYYDLLEVLEDPKHKEYENMSEWVGQDFKPDYFSAEEVNKVLAQ